MSKKQKKPVKGEKNKPGVKAKNTIGTGALDTLAQLATKHPTKQHGNACKISPFEGYEQVEKTRQRKAYTCAVARGLLLAESPLSPQYKRVLFCSESLEIVESENGKVFTRAKRCKSRLCAVCNAIRTMQGITKYTPVIETWSEATFVTLTLTSVPAHQLKPTIMQMIETFQAITSKFKARASRGKGSPLVGIRKLECTYNENGLFHPHFHVILQGNKHQAQKLVDDWISRINKSGYHKAKRVAQNITPVQNIADACNELFKYTTKLFASSASQKNSAGNWSKSDYINLQSLDRILQATTRKRTVQPFGFTAPKPKSPFLMSEIPLSIHVFDQKQVSYYEISTGDESTPEKLPKHVGLLMKKADSFANNSTHPKKEESNELNTIKSVAKGLKIARDLIGIVSKVFGMFSGVG